MRVFLHLFAGSSIALLSFVLPADAGNNISVPYAGGSCAATDCNSKTFYGSITGKYVGAAFATRIASPWVAQFWAENNECFRLTALKAEAGGAGLRMMLIAPDGLVIRRTIGGGVPEYKIVVAYPASRYRTGFWTVIVTNAAGDASEHEFIMAIGRYVVGNANNCTDDANTYWVR